MRSVAWLFVLTGSSWAQQVVAPTDARVGPLRGQEAGGYNVVNSVELGYRFHSVDGNLGAYRSHVNFGNGIRLLGGNVAVHSRDGHGRWFDHLTLNTTGLGNDPYQSAALRLEKNRVYRYDLHWRLNEYYNPGFTVAGGQHRFDTRRRVQDHDLVLLPQSSLRLFLGYSRNSQTGPALSTVQLFDVRGDEFPLFSDIERVRNEYRVGGDIQAFGMKLTWLHRWDYFKEDTRKPGVALPAGNAPGDLNTLIRFRRDEPYHGSSPGWLVNLRAEREAWAANGRFTYVGSRRNFIFDEAAFGTDRFGAERNRQLIVIGQGRRPVLASDFSLSFFPADRVTLVNHTAVHSIRMDGEGVFREFNNATGGDAFINFRYFGIRTVSNATDAQVRMSRWSSVHAGYRFSTRRIRYIQAFAAPPFAGERNPYEQDNQVHAGVFGLRLQPAKSMRVNLDAEIGRANRPFTPISERNYHALGGRVQYSAGTLVLSAAYRQHYNFNSVSLAAHSAKARNYSADASWSARQGLSFDAGYMKLHLDTVSGLAYFAGGALERNVGIYRSEIHAGNFGIRLAAGSRVEWYTGYSITRDGAGNGGDPLYAQAAGPLGLTPELRFYQVFPLRYESPLARVSVRLHERLRWNVGYQYYRYAEDRASFLDYRAHTGFSSLLWSF